MKALFCLVPLTLFALASCGNDEAQPGPPLPSGDTTTTLGNGRAKACRATCAVAADCASGTSGLEDASHFACNAGRCEWLGCASASECVTALSSPKVTCAEAPGEKVPICVATCQTASDCAVSGSALGDAGHFACDAGHCRWTGCKSTSECTAALGNSKTICEKPRGGETPLCLPTCQTPADCAVPGSPLNDAGHFACNAGRCEWLGCRNDNECAAALRSTKVVCE